MGNFGELYREKLFTAAEIAKRAQSGWNIGMDATTSQTPAIIDAVTQRARAGEIEGIKVHMMLEVFPYELYTDSSLDGKINGVSWFSSSLARKAVNSGYADFVPSYYRDSPSLMRQYYDFDAYCASVSPMDEQGYFTLGAVSSYSEAMIEKSKRIFIEVNEFQPRALNGLKLHVSQVDGIVENSQPLAVLPPTKIDEVSSTIGSYIAELIPD